MSLHSQDETRLAEELEALIATLQAGREPSAAALVPEEDTALAEALVELAGTLQPAVAFADGLEREVRERAVARRSEPTREANGAGHPIRVRSLPMRGRLPARRWPAWAVAAGLLLAALLLVPPVQAAVGDLVIGVVHIFRHPPTVTPTEPTPLASVLDLAGRTTLDNARQRAGFPVRLPSYPADLGLPQYVYLQNLDGSAVELVWVDPQHPDRVRMALNELGSDTYVYKIAPQVIQETQVHGQRALWTTGPYLLQIGPVSAQHNVLRRLVTASHTLIWTEGNITYRLESDVSLEEAVHIAESLR
jgi:hypothetical protein